MLFIVGILTRMENGRNSWYVFAMLCISIVFILEVRVKYGEGICQC